MNGSLGMILGLMILIAQGMILKTMYTQAARGTANEAVTLSPEVKAYIDSKTGAGSSPEDSAELFKRVANLEQTAGRLDYLRSTLTALEEAESRLGRMSLEQPISANEVISAARERELQKFRMGLEKICASSDSVRMPPSVFTPGGSSGAGQDAGDK